MTEYFSDIFMQQSFDYADYMGGRIGPDYPVIRNTDRKVRAARKLKKKSPLSTKAKLLSAEMLYRTIRNNKVL